MENQIQQPTPTSQEQTEAKAEVIKLGIDVHQRRHVVVSQTDNETMRSPRGFDPEGEIKKGQSIKRKDHFFNGLGEQRGRFITFVVKDSYSFVSWPPLPLNSET